MMQKVIKIENIKRTYVMGNETIYALRDVSLSVEKGEFVSIMGHSGSGKSTLLNILGCLDTPCGGEYHLNGQNTSLINDDDVALIRNKEIGFVFQNFNLLKRYSAIENVCLPLVYSGIDKKDRLKLAEEALLTVGLKDRMRHTPSELSGGQRQRVAIARALVNNPSLILADEPTGNLDSKTTREIIDLLSKLNSEGNTIVLVTHEDDIAALTKRTITLFDGNIETDVLN